MNSRAHAEQQGPAEELSLYFSPEGEAWRVHVRPGRLPRYLQQCFDLHGEAYPVFVDFEDMARQMQANAATFEQHTNRAGGIELVARGASAESLAVWLSTAFSTGVRPAGQ